MRVLPPRRCSPCSFPFSSSSSLFFLFLFFSFLHRAHTAPIESRGHKEEERGVQRSRRRLSGRGGEGRERDGSVPWLFLLFPALVPCCACRSAFSVCGGGGCAYEGDHRHSNEGSLPLLFLPLLVFRLLYNSYCTAYNTKRRGERQLPTWADRHRSRERERKDEPRRWSGGGDAHAAQ